MVANNKISTNVSYCFKYYIESMILGFWKLFDHKLNDKIQDLAQDLPWCIEGKFAKMIWLHFDQTQWLNYWLQHQKFVEIHLLPCEPLVPSEWSCECKFHFHLKSMVIHSQVESTILQSYTRHFLSMLDLNEFLVPYICLFLA
jgi:hypothetical protein